MQGLELPREESNERSLKLVEIRVGLVKSLPDLVPQAEEIPGRDPRGSPGAGPNAMPRDPGGVRLHALPATVFDTISVVARK